MNKKRSIVLSLVLLIGLTVSHSCGIGSKEIAVSEPYHISLEPTPLREDVPFPVMSEMVDEIEYVKLEYGPGVPVGSIRDTPVITDNYIIISDYDQGVLQYSRNGKFIRRIGHIGRGPGEYGKFNNVRVDEKRGMVYIIVGNIAFRYDLATGKFIEKVTITGLGSEPLFMYAVMSFMSMTDDLWLMSVGEGVSILYTGTDPVYSYITLEVPAMRIIHRERSRQYDNLPVGNCVIGSTPKWRDSGGRLNLYENLADTMFVVNADGSTVPRIIPDFGTHKLDSPIIGAQGVAVSRIKESGRYILFEVIFRYESYIISFDKTTGERGLHTEQNPPGTIDNFFGPANDIDGGFSQLNPYNEHIWWASYNASDMLDKLTPEYFERVRKSVKYPDRLEKLQALTATLREDDNPVIVIAKLKE